ncbi:dihydroorotase [Sphingomonas sp. SUN039]|nr:dihydroorotase [Sphingomonas sp. SUN039]UVO53886.1 dihydroorotase [Sphingomonas sp. SUN039]
MIIRGGKLVDIAGERHGDLVIDGDKIAAATGSTKTIDATGKIVLPGIVDLGVFAVERGASAAGGITRVALMPDQSPVLDDPGLVQRAALAAKPALWVHPLAAATKGLRGEELAEYALMTRAGAKAVATGRSWIADSGVMRRVLAYAGSLGLTVVAHAEDGGLAGTAVATEGETATLYGLPAAPAMAEAMAVARDLALVEETGARLHFRQVTTSRAFDLVRAAKARGLPVTCGIAPTHLLLNDIAVGDYRTFARLSPPLRSDDDRRAAIEALRDGTIDVLCSAHDPRGPEAKRLPFADAEPGASGAETLLTLALGLVRDGVIDLPRLAALTSANPAKLLGVDCGRLETGAPADLVIVDPDKPWRIDGARFASSAGNTPFDGLPVQGKAVRTIKGGRTIFEL